MRDKDELDRRIDAALASYGEAAAGDPIEQRVLRSVQQQGQAADRAMANERWFPWAAALAAAACITAFFLTYPKPMRMHSIDSPQRKQPDRGSTATDIKPPLQEIRPRPSMERRANSGAKLQLAHESMQPDRLPKLDVFPTPHSPTEDEATLAFFIQRAPASEVRNLLQAQAHADAPLIINELEIPPLEPLLEGGR